MNYVEVQLYGEKPTCSSDELCSCLVPSKVRISYGSPFTFGTRNVVAAPLAPGTYSIGTFAGGQGFAGGSIYFEYDEPEEAGSARTLGGTVTYTEVGTSRVRGSYDAFVEQTTGAQTTELQGTFDVPFCGYVTGGGI